MDKEIKELSKELISQFPKKVRNTREIFKEFLAYVYCAMEDKIISTKQLSIKNKYIKIRKSILEYVIANEKTITSEILKIK